MAGRGRGRGRGTLSFSTESLGFGRGEALPTCILQPPPIYPTLEFHPVPLLGGERQAYMLALKQEFRNTMRESPHFIQAEEKKKDIERYSDKYQLGPQDNTINWEPDFSRLPKELRIKVRRSARKYKTNVKPNISTAKHKGAEDAKDIEKKLEALEKLEETKGDEEEDEEDKEKKKEGEDKGEEEPEEEDFYDEEELEEETDYNLNYFDNGEEIDEEDDNLDEGAIY
ncbi:unnamed protein product [Owenia fusiformis]|uniref:DNA-directed RNA polymerase III subunit n=1 Tax=Owenia fusiformis TaxID=6347 RepID=A0A8S4PWF4_OWEFU|nr:unnamed protein product [Owenia fusiformis]